MRLAGGGGLWHDGEVSLARLGLWFALVGVFACSEPPPPPAPASAPVIAAPVGPQIIAAPEVGEVAAIVREAAASGEGQLVVSVGASWCGPCRLFHEALQSGELDAALAGVRFLEFDIDRDKERLAAAGYKSRFVPLFVVPDAQGRASERQIQGAVKGPQAVAHIMARLRPLLSGAAP